MTRSSRLASRSVLARRGIAGGLSALVLVMVSACSGSSDDTTDATDATPSSGSSAEASPDAAPSSEATSDAPPETPDEEIAAGESIDRAEFIDLLKSSMSQASTARITMELAAEAGGVTAEGDVDLSTTPPSMSLSMSLADLGGDIEMRVLDGTAYMKLPQLGGKFVSFDLSNPDNPLGSSFADQLDIGAQFDAFGEAIQEVSFVGNEDVDGESLDHFTLNVDGQAVAEQSGLEAGVAQLPEVITYDMWFDEEGFFRILSFDLGEQAGTTSITYSDWGKDVSIQAPKAGEINSVPGFPGSS